MRRASHKTKGLFSFPRSDYNMRKSSLVLRDTRIMSQEGQTQKEVPFLKLGSGFETVQFNAGIAAGS